MRAIVLILAGLLLAPGAALAETELDVVLCGTEPFPFHQKDRFTDNLRDALPNTPVEVVDGQAFSWYGPRLLDTPPYLETLRKTISVPRVKRP